MFDDAADFRFCFDGNPICINCFLPVLEHPYVSFRQRLTEPEVVLVRNAQELFNLGRSCRSTGFDRYELNNQGDGAIVKHLILKENRDQMWIFPVLCLEVQSDPVRYLSVLQLKNFYSKNRLGIVTDVTVKTQGPAIFTSRPPFDDGWMWTIEPTSNDTTSFNSPVRCGDAIALSNPINGLYLGTRSKSNIVDVIPSPYLRGESDQWELICRNSPVWSRADQIQLKNIQSGCFLSSSIHGREKETVHKFNVTCEKLTANGVWIAAEGAYLAGGKGNEGKSDDL
jgi:hypothetical protein